MGWADFRDSINPFASPPDQPAAPDYTGAAQQTAAGNLDMAKYTTDVNRPDMTNPYGTSTWTQDGDNWSNNVQFSPDQQALYDQQVQNQLLQGDTAGTGLQAASGMFSDPFKTGVTRGDYKSPTGDMPTYNGPTGDMPAYASPTGDMPTYSGPQDDLETYGENRQAVTEAMLARTDIDNARDVQSKESTLVARGIPRGSDAWAREMDVLNRKQNDARQQAEISATQMANLDYDRTLAGRRQNVSELQDLYKTGMLNRNQGIGENKDAYQAGLTNRRQGISELQDTYQTGMNTRNQGIAENKDAYMFGNDTQDKKIQDALLERQTPLNEYNSLMTGTQVNNPAFQQFNPQQQILGPDYMGAATQQGNWDLAGWNAQVSGKNAMTSGLFDLGAAGIGTMG